jgi:hypothetical protein
MTLDEIAAVENELQRADSLACNRERVFEIEELGMELDDEYYASYALDADDNPFLEESKTPIWIPGHSIVSAVAAACARQEVATRSRARIARGSSPGFPTPALVDDAFAIVEAPRAMAYDEAYRGRLDARLRREVIDEASDGAVGALLDLLGEGLALIAPDPTSALRRTELADVARVSMLSSAAVAAMYPQISKSLGGPPMALFTSRDLGDQARVVLACPAVVVVGSDIIKIRGIDVDLSIDPVLRFILGRIVELCRPRRLLAVGGSADDFELLLDAVWHAFGPRSHAAVGVGVAMLAMRLQSRLTAAIRGRICKLVAEVPRQSIDAHGYIASCQRAADRSGLVASGDLAAAIELCVDRADITRLAASRGYRRARHALCADD